MKRDRAQRSKRWTWTLNNWTPEERALLTAFAETGCSYMIFEEEVGEQGTPHLQGYLELTKKTTRKNLQKNSGIGQRLSARISMGSADQNKKYCSKDGLNVYEYGTPMQQGKRSDLQNVRESIDSGASELVLWEQHFGQMTRYRNSFREYRLLRLQTMGRDPPVVILIWGETGVGKSRYVHEKHRELWTWGGGHWFDGYIGQEVALFDDFDGSGMLYRMLLRVLDRYNLNVPVKGAFVPWVPKVIYLTSNKHPRDWYRDEDSAPLIRRFHRIWNMGVDAMVPIELPTLSDAPLPN